MTHRIAQWLKHVQKHLRERDVALLNLLRQRDADLLELIDKFGVKTPLPFILNTASSLVLTAELADEAEALTNSLCAEEVRPVLRDVRGITDMLTVLFDYDLGLVSIAESLFRVVGYMHSQEDHHSDSMMALQSEIVAPQFLTELYQQKTYRQPYQSQDIPRISFEALQSYVNGNGVRQYIDYRVLAPEWDFNLTGENAGYIYGFLQVAQDFDFDINAMNAYVKSASTLWLPALDVPVKRHYLERLNPTIWLRNGLHSIIAMHDIVLALLQQTTTPEEKQQVFESLNRLTVEQANGLIEAMQTLNDQISVIRSIWRTDAGEDHLFNKFVLQWGLSRLKQRWLLGEMQQAYTFNPKDLSLELHFMRLFLAFRTDALPQVRERIQEKLFAQIDEWLSSPQWLEDLVIEDLSDIVESLRQLGARGEELAEKLVGHIGIYFSLALEGVLPTGSRPLNPWVTEKLLSPSVVHFIRTNIVDGSNIIAKKLEHIFKTEASLRYFLNLQQHTQKSPFVCLQELDDWCGNDLSLQAQLKSYKKQLLRAIKPRKSLNDFAADAIREVFQTRESLIEYFEENQNDTRSAGTRLNTLLAWSEDCPGLQEELTAAIVEHVTTTAGEVNSDFSNVFLNLEVIGGFVGKLGSITEKVLERCFDKQDALFKALEINQQYSVDKFLTLLMNCCGENVPLKNIIYSQSMVCFVQAVKAKLTGDNSISAGVVERFLTFNAMQYMARAKDKPSDFDDLIIDIFASAESLLTFLHATPAYSISARFMDLLAWLPKGEDVVTQLASYLPAIQPMLSLDAQIYLRQWFWQQQPLLTHLSTLELDSQANVLRFLCHDIDWIPYQPVLKGWALPVASLSNGELETALYQYVVDRFVDQADSIDKAVLLERFDQVLDVCSTQSLSLYCIDILLVNDHLPQELFEKAVTRHLLQFGMHLCSSLSEAVIDKYLDLVWADAGACQRFLSYPSSVTPKERIQQLLSGISEASRAKAESKLIAILQNTTFQALQQLLKSMNATGLPLVRGALLQRPAINAEFAQDADLVLFKELGAVSFGSEVLRQDYINSDNFLTDKLLFINSIMRPTVTGETQQGLLRQRLLQRPSLLADIIDLDASAESTSDLLTWLLVEEPLAIDQPQKPFVLFRLAEKIVAAQELLGSPLYLLIIAIFENALKNSNNSIGIDKYYLHGLWQQCQNDLDLENYLYDRLLDYGIRHELNEEFLSGEVKDWFIAKSACVATYVKLAQHADEPGIPFLQALLSLGKEDELSVKLSDQLLACYRPADAIESVEVQPPLAVSADLQELELDALEIVSDGNFVDDWLNDIFKSPETLYTFLTKPLLGNPTVEERLSRVFVCTRKSEGLEFDIKIRRQLALHCTKNAELNSLIPPRFMAKNGYDLLALVPTNEVVDWLNTTIALISSDAAVTVSFKRAVADIFFNDMSLLPEEQRIPVLQRPKVAAYLVEHVLNDDLGELGLCQREENFNGFIIHEGVNNWAKQVLDKRLPVKDIPKAMAEQAFRSLADKTLQAVHQANTWMAGPTRWQQCKVLRANVQTIDGLPISGFEKVRLLNDEIKRHGLAIPALQPLMDRGIPAAVAVLDRTQPHATPRFKEVVDRTRTDDTIWPAYAQLLSKVTAYEGEHVGWFHSAPPSLILLKQQLAVINATTNLTLGEKNEVGLRVMGSLNATLATQDYKLNQNRSWRAFTYDPMRTLLMGMQQKMMAAATITATDSLPKWIIADQLRLLIASMKALQNNGKCKNIGSVSEMLLQLESLIPDSNNPAPLASGTIGSINVLLGQIASAINAVSSSLTTSEQSILAMAKEAQAYCTAFAAHISVEQVEAGGQANVVTGLEEIQHGELGQSASQIEVLSTTSTIPVHQHNHNGKTMVGRQYSGLNQLDSQDGLSIDPSVLSGQSVHQYNPVAGDDHVGTEIDGALSKKVEFRPLTPERSTVISSQKSSPGGSPPPNRLDFNPAAVNNYRHVSSASVDRGLASHDYSRGISSEGHSSLTQPLKTLPVQLIVGEKLRSLSI